MAATSTSTTSVDMEKHNSNNHPVPPSEKSDQEQAHPSQPTISEAPDGGLQAWLVAAGAATALFCTLGYSNVIGILNAYYLYDKLQGVSADKISWIGSLQAFLVFAAGTVGGPLFDRYGAWVICPAIVVNLIAIMLTSICTQYWHFVLTQGILTGIANGMIMFPCMGAVPQWFNRRRGAALGITVAGSSLGGLVLPLILTKLLYGTNIGFGWSVRILGFIMLPLLAFRALSVKERLPKRKTKFFSGIVSANRPS